MALIRKRIFGVALAVAGLLFPVGASAQAAQTGTIRGIVTAGDEQSRLHNASVLLTQNNRTVKTGADGTFEFVNIPPGNYDLLVHAHGLSDQRKAVKVVAGQVAEVKFKLEIGTVREEVTVTATGQQQSTLEAIPSTTVVESVDLVQNAHSSLGEALDHEPGVTQRGFGPGSSRPVIRGFSGDRVLVMQDGTASGSIASQSGDHGENIDVLNLERVEIVRGPATLLYGSNAIGGVVNAISGNFNHDERPHVGWGGYFSTVGATAVGQGGGNFGLNYGLKNWRFWGGGGGQRTGDYDTPIGKIANSRARNYNGFGGVGYSTNKAWADFGYNFDDRNYGIPFAAFLESGGTAGPEDEHTNIQMQTHSFKLNTGVRNLTNPFIDQLQAVFGYSQYRHGEYEFNDLDTLFKNKQFNYRLVATQKKRGRLSGSFGVSGLQRDFKTEGAEALAPPVDQNQISVFGLQALDFEHISFQFGGRFEHTGYATGKAFVPVRPDRAFDGASAAVGARVPLWKGGAVIANYTHSFRAPALEELYNFGPHAGNLSFEIGNPDLKPERANGIDLSLRHQRGRFNAEANYFNYLIDNYVFLAPTGLVSDGFFEAEYLQGRSRYTGGELTGSFDIHPQYLTVNAGMDIVNAELRESVLSPLTGATASTGRSLPRIPPMRGQIGLEARYKGFSFRPQVIMASAQKDVFLNETPTAGYALFNLGASYTLARQHYAHIFSVNAFNLNDELYRNHVSFIKDLAPEAGRGVRFSYTVRLY